MPSKDSNTAANASRSNGCPFTEIRIFSALWWSMMPKSLPPQKYADPACCRSDLEQRLVAGDFGDHAVIILNRRCFLASPAVVECTEN
jgi:hypothetical protein